MHARVGTRSDYGEGTSQLSHSRQRETEEALEKTAERAIGHNTYFWGAGMCHWFLSSIFLLGSEHWAQRLCV